MFFKCLVDSFLKEFTAKVLSCEPATFTFENRKLEGFNVVLEDTILFPAGGGQPCDYGTINGKAVRNVVRQGPEAIHFVETPEPFTPGEDAHQVLDWPRRLDHMQQHSGQHLISAIMEQLYGILNPSWWLGVDTSYVEVAAKDLTAEQLRFIEEKANELILEGKNVTVATADKDDSLKSQNLRVAKSLPSDVVGPIRLINIEGVDSNMCCGTHVNNLAQLQTIKMLHLERAKGKLLLHFIIGNRVLKYCAQAYERELQMNTILQGGPASHIDLIQKLQANLKVSQKTLKGLVKETSIAQAEKLNAEVTAAAPYFCLHRRDGVESDFIQTFLRHAPGNRLYFLTVGDASAKGNMVLRGDPATLAKIGPRFMELLDGKGNGKGNNFQGKVNNLNKVAECEQVLKEIFAF